MSDDQTKTPEPTEEEMKQATEAARERYEVAMRAIEIETSDDDDPEIAPERRRGDLTRTEEISGARHLSLITGTPGSEPCDRCGGPTTVYEITAKPPVSKAGAAIEVETSMVECDDPACSAGAEREEWEREQTGKRIEQLLFKSELPHMFEEFGYASFDSAFYDGAKEARDACMAYARSFSTRRLKGKGLILYGSTGTGKTHLAVATMRYVIEQYEVPALFVTMPALLEAERQSYDGLIDPGAASIAVAQKADLLLLDDLGAERASEWVQEKLFALVNHRYSAGLPTIATTNLNPEATADQIGYRAFSRLFERSEWVNMKGPDYRIHGPNKEGD